MSSAQRKATRAATTAAAKQAKKDEKEADKPLAQIKKAPTSLKDLKLLIERKRTVNIRVGEKTASIEFRLLRPDETGMILDRTSTLMPPQKDNPPEGEFNPETHLNWTDHDFIRKKRAVETECRALALYWCVSMFQEDNPDLTDVDDIVAYVQSNLEESLLEQLYVAVQDQPFQEIALANFS